MTINLVHQLGPEQAHRLLEQSFAQYQADRSVVGLIRGIERGKSMLEEIAAEVGGHDAPVLEYARMRAQINELERPRRARLGCIDGRPPATHWPRCAEATSSPSLTAVEAGSPWSWNLPATTPTRGRWF